MDKEYTSRLEKIEAELRLALPGLEGASSTGETNAAFAITDEWRESVFPGLGEKIDKESINALVSPAYDMLSRGGKRWRPLLMTLVCESLDGGENALPLAPLAEFCHNASLIHDDIEDNSDQRRGKPAVHKIYGMDASINSGCFLYFLPLYCIESWAEKQSAAASLHPSASGCPPSESTSRLYRLWAQYMRKLHLGQAMDINWHKHFLLIPSLDDYYTMCALKTGCLARFAAALGVFAAYGTDSAAKTLGQAAEKLGVGFQILDDVKNLTGGVHGKKRGDDIVEGKKSLPALLFLHRQPEKRDFVFRCFKAASENGIQSPEVEEVIEAFAQAGVLEEAKEKGMKLIAEAREIFQNAVHEGFTMKSEICALLAGLTQRIS